MLSLDRLVDLLILVLVSSSSSAANSRCIRSISARTDSSDAREWARSTSYPSGPIGVVLVVVVRWVVVLCAMVISFSCVCDDA